MSEVKVNKLSPRSGTTVTLGDSGDTFTVPSGVTFDASSGGLAGTLTTAAQPNITSVGTLTSLNVDASAGTGVIGITLDNGTVTTSKDSSSFRSQLTMYNTTGQVAKFDTASDDLFLRFADDLAFQSIAGSEYMRINNSGNVGIGTSSPSTNLDISSSGDATINLKASGQSNGLQLSQLTADGGSSISATNNNYLKFSTNATERMRIDSSGNVGIGISSPTEILHIRGNNSDPSILLQSFSSTGGVYQTNKLQFELTASASATRDWDIEVTDPSNNGGYMAFDYEGSELMRIDSSGNVGINGIPDSGRKLHIEGNDTTVGITLKDTAGSQYGINSDGGSLIFKSDTGNTERMRIDSAGGLRINSTGALFNGNSNEKFTVDAGATGQAGSMSVTQSGYPVMYLEHHSSGSQYIFQFRQGNPSSTVGSIVVNSGSSTAYNTSSDYRLKENVNYDFDATTRLKQLKPARFNFTTNTNQTVDGFLAHEVQSVVPEAISGEKDAVDENGNPEYQGIDQSKLVPLLVKTIQELEARITTLENA